MTLSVLTFNKKTGVFAAAAATGNLCVGGWVLRGDIESGLVASQGTSPSTFWRDDIIRRMYEGKSSRLAIDEATANDAGKGYRQVAAIDKNGLPAAFTGIESIQYAGHLIGDNYVISGNMLKSREVLVAMEETLSKSIPLVGQHLIKILSAGASKGGDTRGLKSAALLVFDPDRPPLDLRIDSHRSPIEALNELYETSQKAPYVNWLDEVPVLSNKMKWRKEK